MAFLNKLFTSAIHVVTAPIAVVTDTVGLTDGCTKATVKAALRNAGESVEDLFDGDVV